MNGEHFGMMHGVERITEIENREIMLLRRLLREVKVPPGESQLAGYVTIIPLLLMDSDLEISKRDACPLFLLPCMTNGGG